MTFTPRPAPTSNRLPMAMIAAPSATQASEVVAAQTVPARTGRRPSQRSKRTSACARRLSNAPNRPC